MRADAAAHRSALTFAHIAAVLFGLTGILGALIHADAAVITSGRAAFAVAALAVFARVQGQSLLHALDARRLGVLAVATLGFASFPAFIALLDMAVFRERIGAAEGVLLACVTLGLVLVTPSFDVGDHGTVGLLWGLASGLAFALLAMANRRAARGMAALQVAFWQNLVVALAVGPFALAGGGAHAPIAADWLWLGVLGVFCTGLAQTLFVKSLDALNARSAGMIIALEPVYAIACAWWLFGQQPSARMLAGAALIVGAIVVAARARRPAA